MLKIVAMANQKGGVGKTFLVFQLALFLKEKGYKVLLVDFDPQGNLSLIFAMSKGIKGGCAVAEVFEKERLLPEEVSEGLWLVSADIRLARFEASIGGVGAYFKLKKALEDFASRHPLDYVLIDCPPSLGLFSLSAFVAAEEILVPMRPEMFSVSGLGDLLNVVKEIRENINSCLRVAGLILNAVQPRTRVARETLHDLEKELSLPVLATIPLSIKAEEAMREGKAVWQRYPSSPIARALREGFDRVLKSFTEGLS